MSEPKRLTAADIMTKTVVTRGPYDVLTRIAAEMERHKIGSVVIMENRKLLGILTERDFVRIVERVGTMLEKNLAKDHMTTPVYSVRTDASIVDIIKFMSEKHVRHLIVLDKKGEMAGIISSRDLMKAAKDVMSI
jgi:CBS-domain-containing membrane protein